MKGHLDRRKVNLHVFAFALWRFFLIVRAICLLFFIFVPLFRIFHEGFEIILPVKVHGVVVFGNERGG